MKTVIIGGVAGGATAAARLRRLDEQGEIVLFERGGYVSYANCGLPYYIGGVISDRERLFLQTVEGFSSKYAVDARVYSEVQSIDSKSKSISVKNLQTGEEYVESYDKLILSTGASPRKLNIEGSDDTRIFTLRDVTDTDHIKNYINEHNPKRAVVVGAGFIGLEMVESLHELGIEVDVIQREDQIMLPLDIPMAQLVQKTLSDNQVEVYLDDEVNRFEDLGTTLKLHLKSGKTLTADLVIVSIGVQPETSLAKSAGLALGDRGGIKVDEYMQTSNEDIYAVGDVIEVFNPVINQYSLIPLAGPANKQGRIVADNVVYGKKSTYKGSIGTSIAKIFDLTVAAAGANSKLLKMCNIDYYESYIHGTSNASYYPGSLPFTLKTIFSKTDGKLLGAQVVGYDGVTNVVDLMAEAIRRGDTVYDLQEIEHAYAPPYASAKHTVNIAGYVGQNVLEGILKTKQWDEYLNSDKSQYVVVDVRTESEFEMGHVKGALNIPVSEMRNRLDEIPKDKTLLLYCAVGYNGYLASQILKANDYKEVYNLSGGYRLYLSATQKHYHRVMNEKKENQSTVPLASKREEIISIDARGLTCPGPVMQLKKNYDLMGDGDQLEIQVTDQAFGQDLTSWSNMVGANVLSIDKSGGTITARIEKPGKKKEQENEPVVVQQTIDSQTMIVFSDDMDKALASFVIANGAAAAGKKVTLFFTFWGLNIIKKVDKPKVKKDIWGKMFGMMLPSSSKKLKISQMNMGGLGSKMMRMVMKKKNVETLENMMQQAKDNGVEFIACSMSMDVMGIASEELMDGVTIAGVAAYLERANKANVNLFI